MAEEIHYNDDIAITKNQILELKKLVNKIKKIAYIVAFLIFIAGFLLGLSF